MVSHWVEKFGFGKNEVRATTKDCPYKSPHYVGARRFGCPNYFTTFFTNILVDYTLVIASTGTYRAARQAGYKLAINPKPMINPLAIIKSAVFTTG